MTLTTWPPDFVRDAMAAVRPPLGESMRTYTFRLAEDSLMMVLVAAKNARQIPGHAGVWAEEAITDRLWVFTVAAGPLAFRLTVGPGNCTLRVVDHERQRESA